MSDAYDPLRIEGRWREKWEADGLYQAPDDDPRPKWYVLTMLPYTSGDLHIGHWYAMAPSDVARPLSSACRATTCMFPMGFDAFGLPAENAAIRQNIHPYKWTMDGIVHMRQQLRTMGAMYDWSREVITSQPEYYSWTQWLFLKLYEPDLAYRAKAPVNWCPSCQTVLANEQVLGCGDCERCGTPVIRRDLEQWFFRITKYADELLDHSAISTGRSASRSCRRTGSARATASSSSSGWTSPASTRRRSRVFTTRPDTIYGVTFMVLAPEHPAGGQAHHSGAQAEVEAYVQQARRLIGDRAPLHREGEDRRLHRRLLHQPPQRPRQSPSGSPTMSCSSYGTGAVMAVPAHDQRDFDFAKKYRPADIMIVIAPPGWQGEELTEAYLEPGTMVNSGPVRRPPQRPRATRPSAIMSSPRAGASATVTYRLRDWLISRQRYWGAPIPIVYCDDCGIVPVPGEQTCPSSCPRMPSSSPPASRPSKYHEAFVNTTCPQLRRPAPARDRHHGHLHVTPSGTSCAT